MPINMLEPLAIHDDHETGILMEPTFNMKCYIHQVNMEHWFLQKIKYYDCQHAGYLSFICWHFSIWN